MNYKTADKNTEELDTITARQLRQLLFFANDDMTVGELRRLLFHVQEQDTPHRVGFGMIARMQQGGNKQQAQARLDEMDFDDLADLPRDQVESLFAAGASL